MVSQVLIVGQSESYDRLLTKAFPTAVIRSIKSARDLPSKLDGSVLMVYTDGPIITASIYGVDKNRFGVVTDPGRDAIELEILSATLMCKSLGFGRGSHLLWALHGGRLVIHVTGHRHAHDMVDQESGEVAVVQSYHSQAVERDTIPEAKVLAADNTSTAHTHYNQAQNCGVVTYANWPTNPLITVEAWTLPGILGIQFRPDMSSCSVAGRSLFYAYARKVFSEG